MILVLLLHFYTNKTLHVTNYIGVGTREAMGAGAPQGRF